MTRLACLVVLIALAISSRAGAADDFLGGTPVRPPIQGFADLFRSPPAQVARLPSAPVPASASLVMPLRPVPAIAPGTNTDGGICRPALIAAEMRHGIPVGLLQAIGVVESGRREPATGKSEPWPWTINADGEPHIFDSKQQAVAWVRQAQGRGVQSIDVGCAQVNLMYHPTAFASLEQAFDPAANADYAARFLRELWGGSAGGNWMTAAGQYHSQTPELANGYREQVRVAMGGASPGAPMPAPATVPAPMAPFAPAGPLRTPAAKCAGSVRGHSRAGAERLSCGADTDGGGRPAASRGDAVDRAGGLAARLGCDRMHLVAGQAGNCWPVASPEAAICAARCRLATQWRTPSRCGCSSMVERQLPKLHTRVRFPSPAPILPVTWHSSLPNPGARQVQRRRAP
jgi:hypothetical protein